MSALDTIESSDSAEWVNASADFCSTEWVVLAPMSAPMCQLDTIESSDSDESWGDRRPWPSVPTMCLYGPASWMAEPLDKVADMAANVSPPSVHRHGAEHGEHEVNDGVTVGAELARKAVERICEKLETDGMNVEKVQKLHRALAHLQPPLAAQPSAKAYDLVRDVRKVCDPGCEELGKFAALAVREVLVLQICCPADSMSDVGFESALEDAFQRQLSPELRSQLHLARSAICRLGRDRTVFDRAAPKIFSSSLSQEEMEALFSTYAECTNSVTSASGTSKAAQRARSRRRMADPTGPYTGSMHGYRPGDAAAAIASFESVAQ